MPRFVLPANWMLRLCLKNMLLSKPNVSIDIAEYFSYFV